MTKKQICKEFQKLKFEIFKNRPCFDGPFPPEIAAKRLFLLFGGMFLNKILEAKMNKNHLYEKFYIELYKTALSHYYAKRN